jgi:hypothetical protein
LTGTLDSTRKETTMTFRLPLHAAAAALALGALSTVSAQSNSEIARRIIEKQTDAVPACALLSNDEVVRMTGRKSYTKPEGVQFKNGGSSCTWDSGVNINLFSGPQSAEQHEGLLKAFKADKMPRDAVAGVGDSAFATALLGDKYQGNHALLVVRKGVHTMGMTLEAKEPETPQSVRPKLVTIAKAALAKLR